MNNTFIDCCTGGIGNAVIRIAPKILQPEKMEGYFNSNIVIEDNTFKTFDRAILRAMGTENLVFRNNNIVQTNTFEPLFPEQPVFRFDYCRDVLLEGNSYNGQAPADIKESNSEDIKVKGNMGFE